MKKCCFCLLWIVLLLGCKDTIDYFHDDTIQVERLFDEIQQNTLDRVWEFGLLEEQFWNRARIAEEYGINTKGMEVYIKSAVSEAELCEIAIWKKDTNDDKLIYNAFRYRLEHLEERWGDYLVKADALLKDPAIGQLGSYYYMILGEDNEKVVHYIQKYK